MKKFFLILIATGVALCLAVPAMAGLKLTTEGCMDVKGLSINSNIVDRGRGPAKPKEPISTRKVVPPVEDTDDSANSYDTNDSANSWYQQKMVVNTVLHINDEVRIHGRFTVLEKGWGEGAAGALEGTAAEGAINGNYRSSNNFWWEQLYMSFPLFGGTLYVGRQPGGDWAYPFQDVDVNRDRVKWIRKFGHIVFGAVVEKLAEADGAVNGYGALTVAPALGDPYDTSAGDTDAYALCAVIPFSKNIVWKPLLYYIDLEGAGSGGYAGVVMNALMIKAGPFKLDAEINYRWVDVDNLVGTNDWDEGLWTYWAEAGVTFGPAEIALGTFFVEGTDTVAGQPWKNQSLWGIGAEFQPLLLLTSEDCGLLWNASGVFNNSSGTSGLEAYYLRAGYKISDAMKLSDLRLCGSR